MEEQTGNMVYPTGDRVLVKIPPPQRITPGGIALPPPKARMPGKGIVVATGPGRYLADGSRLAPDVEVGELVFFRNTSGKDIQNGDDFYVMLREEDILMAIGVE